MTAEEALRQAEAEGLTLLSGYTCVHFDSSCEEALPGVFIV